MRTRIPALSFGIGLALNFLTGPAARAQEPPSEVIPQTALSLCRALRVAEREDVAPGTALAVSADGRRVARYFHTIRGAEILLLDRETAQSQQIVIESPQLPPGIAWRITRVTFSPAGPEGTGAGALLVVQSIGAVWVYSAEKAELLYRIDADSEKQLYPGQLQLTGERLLLAFWPPESLVATASPKGPVEVRLYEAASGKWLHTLFLPLRTPDAWTRLVLSPAGDRIAALQRATRWPGKARLALFQAGDGATIWERKIGAEDVAWTVDARELITLGSELAWLDAASGKKLRAARKKVGSSEFQRLRLNDAAHVALGLLLRYNPWKRAVAMSDARAPQFLLWRLESGEPLCTLELDNSLRVDAWPTSSGEVIALEETYDVRPSLRILRAARMVIYRLAPPSEAPRTPPS